MLSASPVAVALVNADSPLDTDAGAGLADQLALPVPDSSDATGSSLVLESAGEGGDADADRDIFRFETSDDVLQLRRELVVIDESASDYQQLVDDLLAQQSDSRQFDIVLLDSTQDGIEQISEILAGYDDLDAVHIVSHGTDGAVKLGGTWLDIDNLDAHAGEIVAWGGALTSNADLLFYGCDLAANEDGKTLIESLKALTAADVAASDDPTGLASLGGDWELEFAAGTIETVAAFSAHLQQEWHGLLAVATVDTTADEFDSDVSSVANLIATPGGTGISLREAITAANNTPNGGVPDEIHFNIGGGGLQTIAVGAGGLPGLTDEVVLDATTQPGYSGNPLIELDGSGATGSTAGILVWADNSTVKGFIIHSFPDEGIEIDGTNAWGSADNNIIVNNWVGFDSTGAAAPNADNGILITDWALNNRIGGTGANDGNVISGNTNAGLVIRTGSDNTIVQGNLIGTSTDGLSAIPNGTSGIEVLNVVTNTQIGGTAAGARNVISGNSGDGILLDNVSSTTIEGNYIGTDVNGTADLGNATDGIRLAGFANNNTIGGTAVGTGNLIAFNDNEGIHVETGTNHAILGNVIRANSGLGIDLGTAGVIGNDAGDGDAGANSLQNFPVLTSAVTDETATVTIDGSINSNASTTFRIEFFTNATNDGSGHGEAEQYLGAITVTTDGSGNATFSAPLSAIIAHDDWITATATVDLGGGNYGDTSEFSLNIEADAIPVITTTNLNAAENQTSGGTVLATDQDVPADTFAWSITGSGADDGRFTIDINTGALTFNTVPDFEVPGDADADNVYEVQVRVNDGTVSTIKNITVTVTDVNGPPMAVNDAYTLNATDTLNVTAAAGVLANDSDPELLPISAVLVSGPSNGALTLNADGSLTYTPNFAFSGTDSFTYLADDGLLVSPVATVTITVTPIAEVDPPPESDPLPDDTPLLEDGPEDDAPSDPIASSTAPPPGVAPPPARASQGELSGGRRDEQASIQLVAAPTAALADLSGFDDLVLLDTINDSLPQRFRQAIEAVADNISNSVAFVNPQLLWDGLDEFQEGLNNGDRTLQLTIGSVVIGSLALSATYVFWTVKGGYLVATVLSQMPAWRFIDPLPIYDAVSNESWKDEDEDALWS